MPQKTTADADETVGNGATPPDGLPADLTSFVGRRQELAQIKRLLPTARLVTLIGVGGVGKTRLAVRTARDLQRAFPDGVALVELAALRDPELLPHTLVNALQISEQSARAPMTILVEYLRNKQALLVLDNCEHLLDACARLIDELLRAAPGLRVLATSRQAIGVFGESLMRVPPLPVPGPDVRTAPGAAAQYAALALFADRASAAVPEFEIGPENEADVARLCQRLEGIPLAIELAAVRLRVLTVTELADRLDHRFQILTGGGRTAPARHQTLRATIDWSFDLCTWAERTLWIRSSVFVGSFDLEGAEAVCSDEDLRAEGILDAVAGLVEKSILIREELDGHLRFRMLETIREYGHERLIDSGDGPELRQRHRDRYLELVDQACMQWFGPTQEQWCTRLQREHANLRAALEFCVTESGQAQAALHLTGRPWFLWVALFLAEGRHWLDRALALDPQPTRERAWALGTFGYVASLQGDVDAADVRLGDCRALARRLDDRAAYAYGTHVLGLSALFVEPARASELLLEALSLYEATDVSDDLVVALRVQLGVSYVFQGEAERALEQFERCRAMCDLCGERWLYSYAIYGLAFVELMQGDLDSAVAHVRESLRIKHFFQDTLGLSMTLDLLAWIQAAAGDGGQAAVLLGAAFQQWETFGLQLFGAKHWMAHREQCEEQARRVLGDRRFEAAFSRGRELSLDQALAYALGEKAAAPTTTPGPPGTTLTRRETEIAGLVADGLSNKEIAVKLVISQRTAEGHIEHILTKLGFTSRAQIAAWVGERRAAGAADGV